MGNESHNDGLKDGEKGQRDFLRSIFDENYDKGEREGEGKRDKDHEQINFLQATFDKDYARGAGLEENSQTTRPSNHHESDIIPHNTYTSDRHEESSTREESYSHNRDNKIGYLLSSIFGNLMAALSFVTGFVLINTGFYKNSPDHIVVLVAFLVLTASVLCLICIFTTGCLGFFITCFVVGIGMILATSHTITLSISMLSIICLIFVILSIIFLSIGSKR